MARHKKALFHKLIRQISSTFENYLISLGTIWEQYTKRKIANFLTKQELAIFMVPGAGIEPARTLLSTGF